MLSSLSDAHFLPVFIHCYKRFHQVGYICQQIEKNTPLKHIQYIPHNEKTDVQEQYCFRPSLCVQALEVVPVVSQNESILHAMKLYSKVCANQGGYMFQSYASYVRIHEGYGDRFANRSHELLMENLWQRYKRYFQHETIAVQLTTNSCLYSVNNTFGVRYGPCNHFSPKCIMF